MDTHWSIVTVIDEPSSGAVRLPDDKSYVVWAYGYCTYPRSRDWMAPLEPMDRKVEGFVVDMQD